jgi:hypothetical protein
MYSVNFPQNLDISRRLCLNYLVKRLFKSKDKIIHVQSLSDDSSWNYENGFYWFSHPTRLSKALAQYEIYKLIINVPGDIFELGVYKGASLIRLATYRRILENDFSRKIIGFDMFGKFPHSKSNTASDSDFIKSFENAGGSGIKQSKLKAILKRKKFENIELIEGNVFNTLDQYLNQFPQTRISFLHLDLDVFAPTEYALNLLYDRVVVGGVLVFDDYNSVEGETLAVDNFIKNNNLKLIKNPHYSVPAYIVKS